MKIFQFIIIVVCCFVGAETLKAIPVDTIQTNKEEICLLLDDGRVTCIEGDDSTSYDLLNNDGWNLRMKTLLDSCVWQDLSNETIGQGHATFIFFIMYDESGSFEKILFSRPYYMSDERFYSQLISIVKGEIEYNPCFSKNEIKSLLGKKCSFLFRYRIDLYP